MVLVDTSVWIDFFQNPTSPVTQALEELIKDQNRAAVCGIVLQEVLQGIRDDKSYIAAKERLERFPFIDADKAVFFRASSIYRKLRSVGVTIPPIDATIAAIAAMNGLPLFTKDEHFKAIAEISELRLH